MPTYKDDADKDADVPHQETLDNLLNPDPSYRNRPTYNKLTAEQREAVGLISLEETNQNIAGDPYGVWYTGRRGSGNVHHPSDSRRIPIIKHACSDLNALSRIESAEISQLADFLKRVPGTTNIAALAREFASDPVNTTPRPGAVSEQRVSFTLNSKTVEHRLLEDLDLSEMGAAQIFATERAKTIRDRVDTHFGEPHMSRKLFVFVAMRCFEEDYFVYQNELKEAQPAILAEPEIKAQPATATTPAIEAKKAVEGQPAIEEGSQWKDWKELMQAKGLRTEVEKWFWYKRDPENPKATRDQWREEARIFYADNVEQADLVSDQPLNPGRKKKYNLAADLVAKFTTGYKLLDSEHEKDVFYNYFSQKKAIDDGNIYENIEKDIVIVVDKLGTVLFANFENLAETLLGPLAEIRLNRAQRMFEYFFYVRKSDGLRHITDEWVRYTQEETDITKATVDQLGNRSMTVGHYGAHTEQGHLNQVPFKTFPKHKASGTDEDQEAMLPTYYKTFFRQIQNIFRFVSEPLDPEHYQECVQMNKDLDKEAQMEMSEDDKEPDFLTYWAVASKCRTN